MAIENIIDVNVNLQAAPITPAGFTAVLIAGDDVQFAELQRAYTAPADILADSDAGLTSSSPQYIEAAAAFAQQIRPSRIFLGRIDFAEPISEQLNAIAEENNQWYGLCVTSRDAEVIEDVASWTESNGRKIAVLRTQDANVAAPVGTPEDIGTILGELSLRRTALLWRRLRMSGMDEVHDAAASAWAADRLAVDPDNQTTVWSAIDLPTIPYDNLSAVERGEITGRNVNVYSDSFLPGGTAPGKMMDGSFIDAVITADWLTFRLEEDLTNFFKAVNNSGSKVGYTDDGINQIRQVFSARLDGTAITAGHLAPGETVYEFPTLDDVDPTDRALRIYRPSAVARLAGSIYSVRFNLDLEL